MEFYCKAPNSDNGHLVGRETHICPYKCSNGACISNTSKWTCTDTDNGKNYSVRGVIKEFKPDGTLSYSNRDFCDEGKVLMEFYCKAPNSDNGHLVGRETHICPYKCSNGACKEEEPQKLCGNGIIDNGEECDGINLGGKTCANFGCTGGTLKCTSQCKFDTSSCTGCTNAVCGNGIIEKGEECDLNNFNGKHCSDYNCTGGYLSCINCKIDTSTCTNCSSNVLNFSSISYSPSPAKDYAIFRANGNGIKKMMVEIFDLSARKIFASPWLNKKTFRWDLKTKDGYRISPGAYVYKITVQGYNGKSLSKKSSFVVVPQGKTSTCPSDPKLCNTDAKLADCNKDLINGKIKPNFFISCAVSWSNNRIGTPKCGWIYNMYKNPIDKYSKNNLDDDVLDSLELLDAFGEYKATTPYAYMASFYNQRCNITKIKTNKKPHCSANIPSTVNPNSVIKFDASKSSDPDGSISSVQWSFGDGSSSTGSKVNHVYSSKGNYVVGVSVIDNVGDGSIFTKDIAVGNKNSNNEKNRYDVFEAKYGWNSIYISSKEPISVDLIKQGCNGALIYSLDDKGNFVEIKDKLKGGKGYFIRTNNKCKLNSVIKKINDSKLNLKVGWNFVGNTHNISLSELSSVCGPVFAFGINDNQTFYRENKTLEAGKGYLIRVNQNCTYIR